MPDMPRLPAHKRVPSLAWFVSTPSQREDDEKLSVEAHLEAIAPEPATTSASTRPFGSRTRSRSLLSTPLLSASTRSSLGAVLKLALTFFGVYALASRLLHHTRQAYQLGTPLTPSCDPFAQPGALFLNIENVSSTVWEPFDKTCKPSHLLPLVEMVMESDVIDPRAALPWLVNKTVVLIGDSIERFSLDYFCEVMDGDLGLIDPSHPWSPAPFQNGRDELREDAETVKTWVADGRPHWCRISDGDINLNLLSFFMYGTAEYAEFEKQEAVFSRPHYYAPVQLSERIDHWVLGTLERAGLTADVVHFSSCLWDVMHWSEVDSRQALSQDVVHAPFAAMNRLEWYRTRLSSALDKVEQAFPTAALVWRRGHEVPCGQFHVPCARNAQFNSVADDVVSKRRERWGVDETGSMIRGHAEFFKDKVHPGKVFRGLWADVLLFELRELYIRSRASVQRGRGEQGVLRR